MDTGTCPSPRSHQTENTGLGELPGRRNSGESACLCESTRRQIVDIKLLGRLWDWAVPFSPHTKGPFLSRSKTETILKGLWNFWAFFRLGDTVPCTPVQMKQDAKGKMFINGSTPTSHPTAATAPKNPAPPKDHGDFSRIPC